MISRFSAALSIIKFAWEAYKMIRDWQKRKQRISIYREIQEVAKIPDEQKRHDELRKRLKKILD